MTDRNLQVATIGLLVILILGVAWIAMQIRPVVAIADSNLGRAIGSL